MNFYKESTWQINSIHSSKVSENLLRLSYPSSAYQPSRRFRYKPVVPENNRDSEICKPIYRYDKLVYTFMMNRQVKYYHYELDFRCSSKLNVSIYLVLMILKSSSLTSKGLLLEYASRMKYHSGLGPFASIGFPSRDIQVQNTHP